VYYCSIPGRFKIHSFRRRRRSTSDQKLVQWSGFDGDLRLQKCFGFCSSGQTMVHTSEKAFKWTSDLQDLQADERPTDASEMAKRWFKSHVQRGTGKAEDAKLPGAGISLKQCPRKREAGKGGVPDSVTSAKGAESVKSGPPWGEEGSWTSCATRPVRRA